MRAPSSTNGIVEMQRFTVPLTIDATGGSRFHKQLEGSKDEAMKRPLDQRSFQ